MSEYFDPVADFRRREAQRSRGASAVPTRTVAHPTAGDLPAGVPPPRSSRVRVDAAGAFVYGVADTVTLGYLDEAGAWLDWALLGKDYNERLRQNRDILAAAQEQHASAFFMGQLGGGFVPFLGWGGRAANAVRAGRLMSVGSVGRMTAAGAVQGGIYGMGSSNAEDWGLSLARLDDGLIGAALGGAGGYLLGAHVLPGLAYGGRKVMGVFRRGRTPEITPEFRPQPAAQATDEVAEGLRGAREELGFSRPSRSRPAGAATPESRKWNDLAGKWDDELEDGAILSTRELLGDPNAARRRIIERVSALTPQQAQRLAQRLEQAEVDGRPLQDPHFRSLLGINLSDADVEPEDALRAAQLLEEATDAIVEKAGLGKKTTRQITNEFQALYGDSVVMRDLDEALARTSQATTDSRLGTHAMMVASVQFARAKERLLPRVLEGDAEAREAMAELFTKSIEIMAKGRAIASNFGRALGDMSHAKKLAFAEVHDSVIQIESRDAIRARVDAAMKTLGDADMAALLSRLRSLNDLEEIADVLTNAERAAQFGAWRRAGQTVTAFLKSNTLTPASGLFNTVGFILHDLFRNNVAKRWAAMNAQMQGRMDDALKLRFEIAVQNGVYWEAHKRGLKALLDRVKWEWWTDVERIAGVGWGIAGGKIAAKAAASKIAMVRAGYRAPDIREFDQLPRLAVTDVQGFNQRLSSLKTEGGAFGNIVYHLHRARAVAANTIDAVGTLSARWTSGALDDWGREFVKLKETYALSARRAVEEGLNLGMTGDELAEWASKRAKELAELPPEDILNRVEQALLKRENIDETTEFLLSRDVAVEQEASRVLFMDGPQTDFGRTSANWIGKLDKGVGFGLVQGVLAPYIRTPVRIFERGLVSYTPWGRVADETRKILDGGGLAAELEKARMELGGFVIGLGAMLGAAGVVKLTNGGWNNSRGLEAPPNRVQIGDSWFELQRMDPFALTIALGAFIGQAYNAYRGDRNLGYQHEEAIETAKQIAYFSLRDAVLEKSYMTSLRDLLKVWTGSDAESGESAFLKLYGGAALRAQPLSGTLRTINDSSRSYAPEAVEWMDKFLRQVPGGGRVLPSRIDPLGDPVDGRMGGMGFGRIKRDDPVRNRLAQLGINITNLERADPAGFDLTSEELSFLREIRGHEAVNGDGMTMRQALAALFDDPLFNRSSKRVQREMVVKTMAEFNEDARLIYEERSPRYKANVEANRSFAHYLRNGGLSERQAEDWARFDVASLGLPEPDRLNQ